MEGLRPVPSIFRSPRNMRREHQSDPSIDATNSLGSTCTTSAALADRRHLHRQQVLKSAIIVFNGGHCTLGCHILNVSQTGAMVRPSDIFLCPREFVLRPCIGSPRDCEVVWRKNDKVGVRYI